MMEEPIKRGPGIGQIKEIQLNEDGKFDFNFDIVLGENESGIQLIIHIGTFGIPMLVWIYFR